MSISSVNPYMSMLATYKAATADTKQSNTPLDTVENTQAKATTRPGDTVTISQEASQKSRAEKYALKDDPIELFRIWQSGDTSYAGLGRVPLPMNELLPENQQLIEELKVKASNASNQEDRAIILGNIDVIKGYGDKEIFTSEQDVKDRMYAAAHFMTLREKYLVAKGESPVPEDIVPPDNPVTLGGYKILGGGWMDSVQTGDASPRSPEELANFDDDQYLAGLLKRLYGDQYKGS